MPQAYWPGNLAESVLGKWEILSQNVRQREIEEDTQINLRHTCTQTHTRTRTPTRIIIFKILQPFIKKNILKQQGCWNYATVRRSRSSWFCPVRCASLLPVVSDGSYVSRKERLSWGNGEHDKQSMGVGDKWKYVAFHLDWVEITCQEHHLPQGSMRWYSGDLFILARLCLEHSFLLFVHRDPDICQL